MSGKIQRLADVLLLALVFLLVNLRSFVFWTLFPDTSSLYGDAWREIVLWLFALILTAYLLWKRGAFKSYFDAWQRQPALIGFVLFCAASVGWSGSWITTLHRSLVFLFASLVAAYIGERYSLAGFIRVLFWVCAIFALGSLLLVLIRPALGTDLNPPYNGAWRGIFWHKNHLGNLLPLFSLVFLFQIFQFRNVRFRFESISAVPLYLLSFLMLLKSNSASGYLVILLLHLSVVAVMFWLKFMNRMQAKHYYAILMIFLAASGIALLNLDSVFGLFNRSSTLTGRLPLWEHLLKNVFLVRPWVGYGFGSIWADLSFRVLTRDTVGWGYQVMIGDNGFVDLLLNIGVLGLFLFLLVYLKMYIASFRYAIAQRELIPFFAPVFMIYTFFANLSYSLLMETEVFIWTMMLSLLFIVSKSLEKPPEN